MTKHKFLGQVYTPQWIVDTILDLTNYNESAILKSFILEPACGDGAFLKEIVNRYVTIAMKRNMSTTEIVKGLEKYIYGFELDHIEYAKCVEDLNALVNKLLGVAKIKWNIFNENTLYAFQKYQKKFDFIVGNPPYIRIHNLDEATRSFIKSNFTFSQGTIDIYLTFFEMAFYMLKPDGKAGFITPNSYLHNSSYNKFREYLKTSRAIHTLIDFKANKIFRNYSTYTAITILEFNTQRHEFYYKELVENQIKTVNKINFVKLDNKDWSFTDKEKENFLNSLNFNKNTSIKDFYDVQYGFATLRDKVYIGRIKPFEQDKNLVYFNNVLVEKQVLKTCIKASKFKGEVDESFKIIFPYKKVGNRYVVISEEELKSKYPYCFDYFFKNKKELTERDIDKNAIWYEYGRSQGVQSMHSEKIVLSTMVNGKIDYYKLGAEVLVYSGIFITKKQITQNWDIIEKVLSSDEFFQFIRITGKDLSGGYKSITSNQIKNYKV